MNKYDDCYYCGGRVNERNTQKICYWGENLLAVVDNVPAGVCEQCGEKYYKAIILKTVEKILKNKKHLINKIQIPQADFKKAAA